MPRRKKSDNKLDKQSKYFDVFNDEDDEEAKRLAEDIRNGIIRPDKFHYDE